MRHAGTTICGHGPPDSVNGDAEEKSMFVRCSQIFRAESFESFSVAGQNYFLCPLFYEFRAKSCAKNNGSQFWLPSHSICDYSIFD
jgi:hypothetical protein